MAEKRIDFAYDAAGQFDLISRYSDAAGANLVAATDFVFDEAGRLTDMTHTRGGTTLADYEWVYDLANRIAEFRNHTHPTETAVYAYRWSNRRA